MNMLAWCRRSSLLSRINVSYCPARFIFEQTGQLEEKYSRQVREQIESHWVRRLEELHVKRSPSTESKEKYYVLSMFPYPSGELHMGHVRVYTLSDALARFRRLQGKEVIHPMGWDAFGLPAENAAIQRAVLPDQWTEANIQSMKKQIQSLCCSFDWEREIRTCDPSYYKWTQYIFLRLHERNLVYQKEAMVNWDPVDETVLADEQIDVNGRSWRSGAKVQKKYLRQWFIRTRSFAQELLEGLRNLPHDWDEVAAIQRNWIGQCSGSFIEFDLKMDNRLMKEKLAVFTSEPEVLHGLSHINIAPISPLNKEAYYKGAAGGKVIPLKISAVSRVTQAEVPVFLNAEVDYGAMDYQNKPYLDSKLGVPSIDVADQKMAAVFGLPYCRVVGDDGRMLNSGELNGLDREEARRVMLARCKELRVGGDWTSPKLNDWCVSRQRYWGTPIPMIHCDSCGTVPAPYDQLPVVLPKLQPDQFQKGPSPLRQAAEWVKTACPRCGGPAHRETDTMDTFVDSSWYFMRYLDPNNDRLPFDPTLVEPWVPVHLYIGGVEHALTHLFSARLFQYFFYRENMVSKPEPFHRFVTMGMVKGETFREQKTGQYVLAQDVEKKDGVLVTKSSGEGVTKTWEKMSKSKMNGISPQSIVDEYGVDFTRLTMLSYVAPTSDRHFEIEKAALRWMNQVWQLVVAFRKARELAGRGTTATSQSKTGLKEKEAALNDARNRCVRNVTYTFTEGFTVNAGIVQIQHLTKALKKFPPELSPMNLEYERALGDLLIMIFPTVPCMAAELWSAFSAVTTQPGFTKEPVVCQRWPQVDKEYHMPLLVTVNGHEAANIAMTGVEAEKLTMDDAIGLVKSKYAEKWQRWSSLPIISMQFKLHAGHHVELALEVEKPKKPTAQPESEEQSEKKEER